MTNKREIMPTTERHTSQVPALVMLAAMGWEILPQAECETLRGRTSRVLLESVLTEQLLKINRYTYRGKEYTFDASDAADAIRQLRPDPMIQRGLVGTNQMLHERLVLGATISKTVEGDKKSYTMRFIDWDNPENNRFQATPEFSVDRNDGKNEPVDDKTERQSDGSYTSRCDIVLLVNGIPFGVIENKAPSIEIKKGIKQLISYQNPQAIPHLFHSVQLLLAMNKNEARYASVGSGVKFWLKWREHYDEKLIASLINTPLPESKLADLFSGDFSSARKYYEEIRQAGEVAVTEQDRLVYALCQPIRLLELARVFSLFDDGKRKIARHQQYFGVKAVIRQMQNRYPDGRRKGGVVWHTQGSGKSLTMVMLGKALTLDRTFVNPRIIIVTDRTDLDVQISETFQNCDRHVSRAGTGAELLELIKKNTTDVITTVINKFVTALDRSAGFKDEDSNIIVLVDEGHRSQHGALAAQMHRLLPKACYVGFTGTPILRKDKETIPRFGGIIEPTYTIEDAVRDGAIVPLIYEGRYVAQHVQKDTIDAWFDKISLGLSSKQMKDLKSKYSRMNVLSQTDQALFAKSVDISEHFSRVWKGTGFKGQVVAPNKPAAIKMKEYFDKWGQVTAEVIISGPDQRDAGDEVDEEGAPEEQDSVRKFWKKMMDEYGDEEKYNKTVIDRFKGEGQVDLIIVVSKLLTGFDCDRNVALYICKEIREHTLLQAIARVNRNCELTLPGYDKDSDDESKVIQKRFGYIYDYEGLLGNLNEAMHIYQALQDFDKEDLKDIVTPVMDILKELPGAHRRVLGVFAGVKNKLDHEQMEQHLKDEETRSKFSQLLGEFTRLLEQALGSEKAYEFFKPEEIDRFKSDWIRLKNLRRSAALRYQDAIDMREYEPRILQLLNDNVVADPAKMIIKPIDLSNPAAVEEAAEGYEGSAKSRADKMERAIKKYIRENLEDHDPALAKKFSELVEQTLKDYEEKRLNDVQLAAKLDEIAHDVTSGRRTEALPKILDADADSAAFYGIIQPIVSEILGLNKESNEKAAEIAVHIKKMISDHRIVRFWSNEDALNRFKNALDDYFFDEVGRVMGIKIDVTKLDELQAVLLKTAQRRFPDA